MDHSPFRPRILTHRTPKTPFFFPFHRNALMSKPIFHASIEGAQHGSKGLDEFLQFAKRSGAAGATL
jgi:hypothetical protein